MNKKLLFIIALILGVALFLGALTWFNGQITQASEGGDYFYVSWLHARSFLQRGDSPYAETVTQNIENALAHRTNTTEVNARFAQPFYELLPYLPFALFDDFALARALWMTFSELALFGIGVLSLVLANWKVSPLNALLFFFALFFSFYGVYPLLSGTGSVFTAFFLLLMLLALREGWDEVLGILLPLGTFSFRHGGILFVLILFWMILQRRNRAFIIAAMTLASLTIISFLLLPNWILPFYANLSANSPNTSGLLFANLLKIWLPHHSDLAAQVLRWLVLLILGFNWLGLYKRSFDEFIWAASLTIALAPFLNFPLSAASLALYLFPLPFIFKGIIDRWGGFTPWLVNLLLLALSTTWFFYRPAEASAFFIFPAFVVLGLYWVRWWSLRAPHTWWDEAQKIQP